MIVKYLSSFSTFFWSPHFWLPGNFTWADLEPQYEYQFTNYRHFYTYTILIALSATALRYILEKFSFRHLGLKLGIKNWNKQIPRKSNILETAYRLSSNWKTEDIFKLSELTDWREEHVSSWLRYRKKQDTYTDLEKFCESSWKFLYYTSIFTFGLFVLWDKPWFSDIQYAWKDFPYHGVTRDIWWYYMLTSAFYLSLLFFYVVRKDFWPMFTHHVATIVLIYFSWICNFQRIGSLVILVHDASNCFLEAAKCATYTNHTKLKNGLFVSFVLVWFATRLTIYPFWIIRSVLFDTQSLNRLLKGFLLVLLILDIYWTKLIVEMIKRITNDQFSIDIGGSYCEGEDQDTSLIEIAKNYHVD